jgi:hypothetical protein
MGVYVWQPLAEVSMEARNACRVVIHQRPVEIE